MGRWYLWLMSSFVILSCVYIVTVSRGIREISPPHSITAKCPFSYSTNATKFIYMNESECPKFPANKEFPYKSLSHFDNDGTYLDSDPVVCVVIRTYKNHKSTLPGLLGALGSNKYPHLHAFLVDTVGDFTDMHKFADLFNSIFEREFVHVSDSTPTLARSRYPKFDKADFGYLQTDLAIEQLSSPNSKIQCEYFIATNGDNLYTKELIYRTIESMRQKIDLIGFHFITHYCYEKSEPWRPRPGCFSQHYTEFKLGRVDVGSALLRKDALIKYDANFIINELEKDETGQNVQVYFCDGFFYEYFAQKATQIVINATLFIHQ